MAAPLPPDAARAVHDALAPLRDHFPEVRWTAPEQLHLTLVFLGSTESTLVPRLERELAAPARAHAAYEAETGAAGGRVDERPGARRGGVAWLHLERGAEETAALALASDIALGSATYDARRRPRPHLTVARNVTADVLAALRERARDVRLAWQVERIVLYRSHTGPRGSRYEELGSFPLTRGHADA